MNDDGLSATQQHAEGSAFLRAAKEGHTDQLFQLCSSLGGKIDVCSFRDIDKGRNPLHYACLNGDEACVELILQYTSIIDTPDVKGKTPLALATKKGNATLIEALIKHGANPNVRSKSGNTAVHQASYNGHLEALQSLIIHDGNVNALNDSDMSPLHFAAMCGHHQTCELLLQHGARPNSAKRGTTPLHLAARNGYAECCKILIRYHADLNSCDQHQQIPLHLSARAGHLDCLKVMIEEGAEVNAMDTEGNTPFDWADEGGHGECAVFLWENGAHIKTQTGKETMCWYRPYAAGSRPTMRYDHAMAAIGDKIFAFGGYGVYAKPAVLPRESREGEGGSEEEEEEEEEEGPSAVHMNDICVFRPEAADVGSIGTLASLEERVSIGLEMSQERKGRSVAVSEDGLTVEYAHEEIADVGMVQTTKPWKRNGGEDIAYFEATIQDQGMKGYIAIGLTSGENYPLNKQPGWVKDSYGYHGDDGQVYRNQGSGTPFGPRFGTGDVVGCGLIFKTGEVFFTKNGTFLGAAWSDAMGKELFPSVGLHSPGEKVLLNFGKRPFKFNLEAGMINFIAPKVSGDIPGGRATASLLPIDDRRLLLLGGYSSRMLCRDIHVIDIDTFTWKECKVEGTPPSLRDSSVCNLGTKVVVFGGKLSNNYSNRVYFLQPVHGAGNRAKEEVEMLEEEKGEKAKGEEEEDTNEEIWRWEDVTDLISGESPRPRACHAAGVVDGKVYIFGGDAGQLTDQEKPALLNDVFILDTEKMEWRSPRVCGRPPTARQNASLTVVDKRLFIFGGWDGRRQHNDIHIFDTETASWYKPHVTGTVPRPRNHHACAMLMVQGRRKIFFFGGWNGRGYMEDLDVLDIDPIETSDLGVYANNKALSDVTFWVQRKPIYAHKAILSSRSRYFRLLFSSEIASENSGADVAISDCSYAVFLAFLRYLYTDVADASPDMIGDMLSVTRKYGEEHMERVSEYLILTRLKTSPSLNHNLAWAFDNEAFSDVVFVFMNNVEEHHHNEGWGEESGDHQGQSRKTLHAHKVILCARSPYFRALLLGGLRESRDRNLTVDTSETPYPIFMALIRYLYTNDIDMGDACTSSNNEGEDWLSLLVASNKYSISSLKQLCQDVLEQSVDVDNAACLYALADTQQALSLKASCAAFMLEHVDAVKQTESFAELSEELKAELFAKQKGKRKRTASDKLK